MTEVDEKMPYDRLWRVKYWYKKQMHRLSKCYFRFARSKRIAVLFPPVTGAYYLTLDVWGDKLAFVKNYESQHRIAFFTLLGITLTGLFVRGFIDEKKNLTSEEANQLLTDFIKMVGLIVDEKTSRFRNKLFQTKLAHDKFGLITHPDDQLHVIFTHAVHFLRRAFSLEEDQIDITIIRKKDVDTNWNYLVCHQRWKHGDAHELMNCASAAKSCIDTGEPIFFPDKVKAAQEGLYSMSRRDKRRQLGSAYVMPISFPADGFTMQYIVSIVTYGAQLCDEWDEDSKAVSKGFLREICRRMEIELCLHTIKMI